MAVIRGSLRVLAAGVAVVAIAGLPLLAPATVRGASPGLRLVTHAQYLLLPDEKRIHVIVDATATNDEPDPPGKRGYFTDARFGVQPDISNLSASSGGSVLPARVVDASAEFTTIEVTFGAALFHGQSVSFRFTFDILDPGGAPQRDVRVAASLVAFPLWAFGSTQTAGSSVRVVVPAGYTVTIEAGALVTSHGAAGETILTADAIPDPDAFFAYVTAERPGAFTDRVVQVALPEGSVSVRIRAWDDDPEWGARLRILVTKGLPELRKLIGIGYQVNGTLTVEEAAASRLGDYAGVYSTLTESIDLRYDADGYAALHEATHSWFNQNLFEDRWIGEAWAEYYGVVAGRAIGTDGQVFSITPALAAAKIPLNAWGSIGSEPPATEDYAYAATYRLAQLIAARAGTSGLQKVWRAQFGGEASYQPAHPAASPEKGLAATVEGWQRLLDLLDERTGQGYEDLWRTWVVTADQATELAQRDAARAAYARTVAAAGDWQLPYQVRYTLGSWQFDRVEGLLADANAVLAARDRIAAQASGLHLTVPGTVRSAFESGTTFTDARHDADLDLAALAAIARASTEIAAPAVPVEWAGLLLADPGSELEAARAAFQQGDADAATRDARLADALRSGAADAGRIRVGIAGGAALLLDVAAMGILFARRRRRGAAVPELDGSQEAGTNAPERRPLA